MLKSKELKSVLAIFEELKGKYSNNRAFQEIEQQVKQEIFSRSKEITDKVSEGISPKEAVYAFIANIAGDRLESGNYHIYRGVLNSMTCGEDILKLFDEATDELKQIGSWTAEQAERQKKIIRDNIKKVG